MASMAYLLLLCLFSSLLAASFAEDAKNDSLVLPRAPCPPGVLHYNRNCYEFIHDKIFWEDAEHMCTNLGGAHLASVLTAAEERMITAHIRRYSKANVVWIGLKAEPSSHELIWKWSDSSSYVSGSPLWDNRKPETELCETQNPCKPEEPCKACIALNNVQNSTAPRWTQHLCEEEKPFICKYKASF